MRCRRSGMHVRLLVALQSVPELLLVTSLCLVTTSRHALKVSADIATSHTGSHGTAVGSRVAASFVVFLGLRDAMSTASKLTPSREHERDIPVPPWFLRAPSRRSIRWQRSVSCSLVVVLANPNILPIEPITGFQTSVEPEAPIRDMMHIFGSADASSEGGQSQSSRYDCSFIWSSPRILVFNIKIGRAHV